MSADLSRAIEIIADAIATRVVERIKPMLSATTEDPLVSRETCGVSRRWWDRSRGRAFPCFRDGRKWVAHRSQVMAALERERRFTPKPIDETEVSDADDVALARAGIRLASGDR
jgi:hypothetical protein